MSKSCFKCGETKPLSGFYKHPGMADGHLNACKECKKTDVRADYVRDREAHRAYERQRFQQPERKKKIREYQDRRREQHPQKYRARTAVGNAVRDGKLVRQPCVMCGDPKSQAHHARGYVNALDVDWLCFRHHREAHGQQVGA